MLGNNMMALIKGRKLSSKCDSLRRTAVLLVASLTICTTAVGEWSNWPPIIETSEIKKVGARLSPLVVKKVENGSVLLQWDPTVPEHGRRLSGRRPKENAPSQVRFRLSHIRPRYSSDRKANAEYLKIYSDGLRSIVDGQRLGIETTEKILVAAILDDSIEYEIGGIVSLNEYFTLTVQERMVALGYAQVQTRESSPLVRTYGDSFRDKLLRLEGVATHLKKGVWKE
jgi:hypothetical protein